MLSKVLKHGNRCVIALPPEALAILGVQAGQRVAVTLDRAKRQIVIRPAEIPLADTGVDNEFARQVSEFVETYRPALEALAKANSRMP